ncbi:DF family (seleno)protein [Nocardioides sp.]|uniref:Ankyrin (Modular protein) n=1 Tax=metagenome TaxID=256318 RepID=A0A2P2C0R7_9ZZZZ
MTAPDHPGSSAEFATALFAALVAGTREAFTALLTDDVHWGGEHGGNQCTSRAEAGDHYDGLLAAGVTITRTEIHPDLRDGPDGPDSNTLLVRLKVDAPDPDDFPAELTVRLTLRKGLIADIRELDPPPSIELLFFDGCPHHETFLPHLRQLLGEYAVAIPITLVRIDSEDDARARRFLGSPSLRVNGHDVDLTAAGRNSDANYGLQCRLYSTPNGTTGTPPDQWILDALIENPTHEAAITAVRGGELSTLTELLDANPGLAAARLARHESRTLLHIATDWPGHYPGVAATIAALVAAGADPNAASLGDHAETPLHWAASSGDLDAINALLDAGADLNATGAVIAGGTPMADATAFGQWEAARLLLDRGASTNLFEAAALGLVSRVIRLLGNGNHTLDGITSSFWGACHGGQLDTAIILLDHGADLNWVGYDELTPLDAARRAEAPDLIDWLEHRGARTAAERPT